MWAAPRSRRRAARLDSLGGADRPGLRTQATVAVALVAVIVQLPACALMTAASSPSKPAAIGSDSPMATAIELTRALAERDRGLDSMQTPAVMEFSNPEGHFKAREVITLRRPQSLRIEALSPFGVALVVAASDSRLAIFRSSDNTLMYGAATADTLNRFARVPLPPKPAVDLLMGLAPDADLLTRAPDSVRIEDGVLIASYRSADGDTLELGFSGRNLALVRHRLADSRISYEVRYSDFEDIGGLAMAYEVDADFPLAQSRVKFRLQRPIVNGAIADSMFELLPGTSTRQIDLDRETRSSTAPADG
jgi:hypothetical protein